MFRKLSIALFCLILLVGSISCSSNTKLKVFQINIWLSGTSVNEGFQAVVDNIVSINPDVVLFSEADSDFVPHVIVALKEKGLHFYGNVSRDAALISKYPIKNQVRIYPSVNNGENTTYKATLDIKGKTVVVYAAHLDYTHYACYLPRGYSGSTWKKLAAPILNIDSIQFENEASVRDEAINLIIADASLEQQKGHDIILGGDFNEASDLDWTEGTKNLRDHHGMIIPWYCSVHLRKFGFKDAFRELYPDPVDYPGFTYPANNTAAPINKLTWAPDADERERIDYIYYIPSKSLQLKSMTVVGPSGCIVHNQRQESQSKDTFVAPHKIWPTDHKATLAEFYLH